VVDQAVSRASRVRCSTQRCSCSIVSTSGIYGRIVETRDRHRVGRSPI
jgi:hypothetical protein